MNGMKTLTTLLAALLVFGAVAPGLVAADVQSEESFDGDINNSVSVDNQTLTVDPAAQEIDVTLSYTLDDYDNVSNESVMIDTNFEAVNDVIVHTNNSEVSEQTTNQTTTYTVENLSATNGSLDVNLTVELQDLEDGGNHSDAIGHSMEFTHNNSTQSESHNGTTYDMDVEQSSGFQGGTIGNLPVPDFFQQYDALGAFIFYAIVVGGVLFAGIALYLVATGNGFTRGEKTTATAMVSFGSLTAVWSAIQENMLIVVLIAVVFAALVVVLWKRESASMTMHHDGTEYWD
jgi:hypothetical protein